MKEVKLNRAEQRIVDLFNEVLPEGVRKKGDLMIVGFVEAGEATLALENLGGVVHQRQLQITPDWFEQYKEFVEDFELDPKYSEQIKHLVSDEK